MNSKLRDILNHLGERHIMVEHRLIHVGMPEKNGKAKETAEAEKAIRQAVGEEMIGLLPDEIVNDDAKRLRDGTFVRGDNMRRIGHNDCLRELRQKIKQWAAHQGAI